MELSPIKKMQCGKPDGLKFVDKVREQFGADITLQMWQNKNRQFHKSLFE